MPGRSRQALRTRALAVVLAAIGLVLAGCAETNEVRTQASSDGLRAELGGLLLSNLMVLAAGEGKPGTVLGAVANHADGTVTVSIGVAGETRAETFEVAEEATVRRRGGSRSSTPLWTATGAWCRHPRATDRAPAP